MATAFANAPTALKTRRTCTGAAASGSSQTLSKGARHLPSIMAPARRVSKAPKKSLTTCMATVAAEDVPSPEKRGLMNLLLLGAGGLPTALMAGPYLTFFVPEGAGGAGGAQTAKDALGNDITVQSWTKTHQPGDHSLSQGLKGDPTYIIVKDDGTLEDFGLNAVCTHLGCVVPWVGAENKFKCPCHGSQYNNQGKVIRGPAPLSLALAHLNVDDSGKVLLSTWTETDFRTGENPWWS